MRPGSGDSRLLAQGAAPYALYHVGTSGTAVAVATAVTHPLDVIKVRLQMQLAGQRGNLVGMGTIFTQMVEREGPRSLYLGFAPALTRSVIYGGLRLGLYEPCKYVCSYAFGSTNFAFKFASGVIAGALATALTNPTEVLKVRSQMSTSRTSTIGVMRKIVAEEGLKALWKGVGPAMARAGCLTASQMATYDEAKQALLKWTPLEEGFQLHLMSSCIAGTAGTLVTAPMDMIKTRLMLQRESKGARVYRNGFHCAYQVVLTEGVKSLYKGSRALAMASACGSQGNMAEGEVEQRRWRPVWWCGGKAESAWRSGGRQQLERQRLRRGRERCEVAGPATVEGWRHPRQGVAKRKREEKESAGAMWSFHVAEKKENREK